MNSRKPALIFILTFMLLTFLLSEKYQEKTNSAQNARTKQEISYVLGTKRYDSHPHPLIVPPNVTASSKPTTVGKENNEHPFEESTSSSETLALKVVYKDLSKCPPKPKYFHQYRAHCWGECQLGNACSQPPSFEDVIPLNRAKIYCVPDLHLVGVKRSGTTDFTQKWFTEGHLYIDSSQQDYTSFKAECPVKYFQNMKSFRPRYRRGHRYNGGPGNLMSYSEVKRNATHLVVATVMQYLGYMSTPDTKFYVQLRNPTDRTISHLFHWHQQRASLYGDKFHQLNGSLVDNLVHQLIERMNNCIDIYGELGCIYQINPFVGSMDAMLSHSLYFIYVQEMFKFVPRSQCLFMTMDDYGQHELQTAMDVSEEFFRVKFPDILKSPKKNIINKGKKKNVWPSTLQALDKFFAPYNKRLAALLNDDRFLFEKIRY